MAVLLVLVIVLPLLLLLLGVGLGVTGTRWWATRHSQDCVTAWPPAPSDEEAATEAADCSLTVAASPPSTTSTLALPPGRKDSRSPGKQPLPSGIHIVASSASFQHPTLSAQSSEACLPLGLRLVSSLAPRMSRTRQELRPAPLRLPSDRERDSCGNSCGVRLDSTAGGSGSLTPGGGGSRVWASLTGGTDAGRHRKTASLDVGQLVRAGPSAISQAMDDWETRSALYRIMSLDNLPSPQQQQAALAGLMSPAGAGNSGGAGDGSGAGVPAGEVHMDEIDLMECIGKGGNGCVYKASWRGAGVAVKYIVCPTDDSDSLGRAIREVVLSKKMSHPNVVQCYSWTLLTGPDAKDGRAAPTSRSGLSSPREQSFTSRRRGQVTGRASQELLRPSSGSGAVSPRLARLSLDSRFNAAAGGGFMRTGSGPTLQRITERATMEGGTLQQEVEAAVGAPHASHQAARSSFEAAHSSFEAVTGRPLLSHEAAVRRPRNSFKATFGHPHSSLFETAAAALASLAPVEEADAAGEAGVECAAGGAGRSLLDAAASPVRLHSPQLTVDVTEQLVAEAAADRAAEQGSACPSGQTSPDVPAAACFASSKQLKLLLPLPPSSVSPSSSPGIQAVHVPPGDSSASPPAGLAAAECVAGQSAAPSPDHHRSDACSVGPASLPASPFASDTVQSLPVRGIAPRQLVLPMGAAPGGSSSSPQAGAMPAPQQQQQYTHHLQQQQQQAEHQAQQQQRQVQQPDMPVTLACARPQSSEEDEGEDVYARFLTYEDMVEHFQRLAAEGRQKQHGGGGDEEALAAAAEAGMVRLGSLRLDASDGFAVTAASSFSDVLSMSGFMLENSNAEALALSLPSSPRHNDSAHGQQLRSGQSSWFHPSTIPSAASSRPVTPRTGFTASAVLCGLSRLARAASAAPQAASSSLRPSLDVLAAAMPPPSWQVAPAVRAAAEGEAEAAVEDDVAESEASDFSLPSSRSGSRSSDTEAEGEQQGQGQEGRFQQQQHSSVDFTAVESSGQARPASLRHSSTVSLNAWHPPAAGGQAVGALASGSDSPRQLGQHDGCAGMPGAAIAAGQQQLSLPGGSGLCTSGAVTPRLCSLSNLGPAGCGSPLGPDGSPRVTPRQQSLLGLGQDGSPRVTPRQQSMLGLGPDGSPRVTPRQQSVRSLGPDGSPRVTPRQQSLLGLGLQVSPRAESARSLGRSAGSGRRRVEDLREEGAVGSGGTDAPTSCDRQSLGSHNDSFNSEEGFGSPVKQRCGGVKDVFQLEELQLSGQDALMVVVMEFCDLGSLRKALKRKAFRPSSKWPFQTTYRALLRTAQEVAKGMGYIHEFNIVHGDLKPGNVLLKTHKVDRRGYIAKVSDFGLSRPLDWDKTHASTEGGLGTIPYTAPETFAQHHVFKQSDVYAFGIMLWEMFYCRDPYDSMLDAQICSGVSDGWLRPEFEDDCPEPYRILAERCWQQNPEVRPSFEEVDRELVRIEMEFRLHRHRTTGGHSKRASATSQGGTSLAPSRPGSPEVVLRGAASRQLQAAGLAD